MNNFVEQTITDTLKGYKTDTPYQRGIAAGLKLALDIIEAEKRINGEVTISKEEVA